MPTSELTTIADLRASDATFEWPEAVALVAALADVAVKGDCPLPDEVRLNGDGTFDVPVSAPLAPDEAVAALGGLLRDLLARSDGPRELTELANGAASGAGPATLDELRRTLHFFERPGREAYLRSIAGRSSARKNVEESEVELALLRERARRHAEEAPEPAKPEEADVRRPLVKRRILVAASIGAAAAAIVAAVLFTPASVREAVARPFAKYFAPPEITPKPLPTEDEKSRGSDRTAARRTSAGDRVDAQPEEETLGGPGGTAPGGGDEATPASGATSRATRSMTVVIDEDSGRVISDDESGRVLYSASSPGVRPPVLLRQTMPSAPPPDTRPEDLGAFDLTIDDRGDVERVRLVSPRNRFQERMLVASAKAWRFQPATLDGRPVRYRMLVRITW
jgi:hypothetical protein